MDRFLTTEINKKLQEKVWQEFLSQLKSVHSIKKLDEIFNTLLSFEEELILKRRLAVKFLLEQNKRHKEISEILGVSRQTINVVKRSLLEKSYKTYRKRRRSTNYRGRGRWRFLNM